MNAAGISNILGESPTGEIRFENKMDIVRLSQKGLTIAKLKRLADYFGFTMKEAAGMLQISERQLTRYPADYVLPLGLSARAFQIAEVCSRGLEVFEDRAMFSRWLRRPIMALGFAVPLDLMATPQGVEILLDELGRIEHGLVA